MVVTFCKKQKTPADQVTESTGVLYVAVAKPQRANQDPRPRSQQSQSRVGSSNFLNCITPAPIRTGNLRFRRPIGFRRPMATLGGWNAIAALRLLSDNLYRIRGKVNRIVRILWNRFWMS